MGMRTEQKGWEPILESQPSDKFICNYGGQFAQQLGINRPVIERFLSIAALGGSVVLADSKFRRPRAYPDINPDGSVTSKGVLRFGEKIHLPNREPKEKYQIDLENGGFRVAINGDLILEDLTKDGTKPVRGMEDQFSREFNYLLRVGLKEALLKDKLTFQSDPVLTGRMLGTFFLGNGWFRFITNSADGRIDIDPIVGLMFYMTIIGFCNFVFKEELDLMTDNFRRNFNINPSHPLGIARLLYTFACYGRRSVNNVFEGLFAPPFEIDRLALAYGYLDYQMLRGNPIVRVAPD